jgi:hypothetical protein
MSIPNIHHLSGAQSQQIDANTLIKIAEDRVMARLAAAQQQEQHVYTKISAAQKRAYDAVDTCLESVRAGAIAAYIKSSGVQLSQQDLISLRQAEIGAAIAEEVLKTSAAEGELAEDELAARLVDEAAGDPEMAAELISQEMGPDKSMSADEVASLVDAISDAQLMEATGEDDGAGGEKVSALVNWPQEYANRGLVRTAAVLQKMSSAVAVMKYRDLVAQHQGR